MKPTSMAGILLVVLGVLALIYQGFSYTHREKVFDVGPIHATADERKEIPIPPIFGGFALAGGVALLVMGARRRE
ncbi:MAG TPA: hypothetical protein VNV41_15830 [Candidatus Acidoferrales bacterium]|jgi:hypothetical protein|nr:hypothetical protein [Candidatus Acidoferrales bacterium]